VGDTRCEGVIRYTCKLPCLLASSIKCCEYSHSGSLVHSHYDVSPNDNPTPLYLSQDNRLQDGPHEYEYMDDQDQPKPPTGEYQTIPDDFLTPPPASNQTLPELYEYQDIPSNMLTHPWSPDSAYETPMDAKAKARTIASPIQYPPVITDYETPIDAMKTL